MSTMTDETANFDPADIQANKGMACLSYIGILFLIPMVSQKNSPFCKFHINQGIVVFILFAIISVITTVFRFIPGLDLIVSLLSFVSLFPTVLMIMGIIFAVQGRAKRLPLIGNIQIYK